MSNHDIYGMCNAIVDILAKVDDKQITDLGLDKGIMKLVDEQESQKLLAAISKKKVSIVPGGSGSNTMVGVANLGGKAMFCGIVANDEYGKEFERGIKELGVKSALGKGKGMTGTSVILITPDSERTMNTCLGVCRQLSASDVKEDDIKSSKIFHTTGYLIDTAPEAGYRGLELAKKHGVPISFDLSDPFLINAKREELRNIVELYADIAFLNAEEARLFTGKPLQEAAEEVGSMCETAIVKVGSMGSILVHKGKTYKIPAFKVNAVDTTGAGDMYAAGYLFGITNGYDEETSASIGSYAASQVVEMVGPRIDRSLKNEVRQMFE